MISVREQICYTLQNLDIPWWAWSATPFGCLLIIECRSATLDRQEYQYNETRLDGDPSSWHLCCMDFAFFTLVEQSSDQTWMVLKENTDISMCECGNLQGILSSGLEKKKGSEANEDTYIVRTEIQNINKEDSTQVVHVTLSGISSQTAYVQVHTQVWKTMQCLYNKSNKTWKHCSEIHLLVSRGLQNCPEESDKCCYHKISIRDKSSGSQRSWSWQTVWEKAAYMYAYHDKHRLPNDLQVGVRPRNINQLQRMWPPLYNSTSSRLKGPEERISKFLRVPYHISKDLNIVRHCSVANGWS